MAVTAQMIKELRERTGVGMGKCKEALEQAGGNMEEAVTILRKAGIAGAVKKGDRAANEGMIAVAETGDRVAIVEVNAETDFVAKNERFLQFLEETAREVAATGPASLEEFLSQKSSKDPSMTIDERRASVVQAIGENIQIRRLKLFAKGKGRTVGSYSHLGGKIVTVVEIEGSDQVKELADGIAMHIAAADPGYLSQEDVPSTVLEQEREIARSQIKGKPEDVVQKIVEGKVVKFYDENCLLRQPYIRDDSVRIGELVEKKGKEIGSPLRVVHFHRWSVGQQA